MKFASRQPERKGFERAESPDKTDVLYWKSRLIQRRYHFAALDDSEKNLAAYIDHAGVGYFFPLGSQDPQTAGARALRIYQTVLTDSWKTACQQFSRELIISFEWCQSPVLWTYTTIHTLVGQHTDIDSGSRQPLSNRQPVMVVETDAGIRRALCWSIDQQSGLTGVPCDSVEMFERALADSKPVLVLLSRTLAGRIDHKSVGKISHIRPAVPAITYSSHADGDQMFVSTPGGAVGYMVKRVKPDRLLEPVLQTASHSESSVDELVQRVKYYFQGLLQLHSPSHASSALAQLTPREREVMDLMCKGHVDKEIAQAMNISAWTVHGHIKKIFERLHVRTRTEAVVRYLEK
jgi:DNA-binding NarL/FixJ family response regulator